MAINYVSVQEDISKTIEKAYVNFKKSPKERITLAYVDTRLESLEQKWKSFDDTHRKIVLQVKTDELNVSSYRTDDVYEKTEELYLDYKSLLKDCLSRLKPKATASDKVEVNRSGEQSLAKLPKISLPKFSGKYSEWASFRDLFISLIHKNSSIDDVQKLHYLKSSLVGEAANLIAHIPITAVNYKPCWSKLENRYNNKKHVSNCILERLIGQKALKSESSGGLKLLLDTTKECLQALENLGIDISSWDIIVIFIISQKLDPESRKAWEDKVSKLPQELATLNDFEDFLEKKFRSLEYLDQKVNKSDKVNCNHLTTTSTDTSTVCLFCAEAHKLVNCKKFAKETVDARRKFVQKGNLCFNCLSPDHTIYNCTISTRCRLCKKKHHTLLHPKSFSHSVSQARAERPIESNVVAAATTSVAEDEESGTSSPVVTDDESSGTPSPVVTCFANTCGEVLLATALIKVVSGNQTTTLRSLVDQGSQASFITESAVQMLGLKKTPGVRLVSGLGGDQGSTLTSKSSVLVKIQSRLDPSFTITVKANVLNKLTTFLPSRKVVVQLLPAISTMELADPTFDTPNKIDLLLGAEVYSQILLQGLVKAPSGSIVAQHTRLGWILSGRTHSDETDCANHSIVTYVCVQQDENELLKKFWELESEPSSLKTKHLTLEERKCEEIFSQTTTRDESGRYVVKLPFKSNNPQCRYGNSRDIARKRFFSLERRLLSNPSLKLEYSDVLKEYLQLGHMEVIPPSEVNNAHAVYLPHHAVIRQDKTTTKVRVVHDASCKYTNGVSLNDDLLVGPTLQPELRHLVMRWRCYPISLVADIVKMYRQVAVAKEDADYQRLLWREPGSSEFQHLRLIRLTFGTSCAPFLAVRCLQQLAVDEGTEFPLASDRVLTDFYMDDLMTGCYSVDEGVQLYKEMSELLNRGGFPLQKWASNNRELLKHVDGASKDEDVELKTDEIMKILGLTWNKRNDEFRCTVKLLPVEGPVTKRKVISDIARLFDPLGWLAPAITTAKVFIQRLWLSGIEWDAELPSELLEDWLEFRNQLCHLTKIRVPRWINKNQTDRILELHGFSDASNVAYAAVVYARVVDQTGNVFVHLVTSKTRVAPIKQVSIPRLELCGAVLLAKLLSEVAEVLEVPKQQLHAWTDSEIVLAWLSSHPSRWKTFIGNRVSEILTILDTHQWSHVASKENPADCASRGLSPADCVENQLWYRGPQWLHEVKIEHRRKEIKDTKMEERKQKTTCHTICDNEAETLFSKFSSLRKLTRVLSYCRRVLRWKNPEKEDDKISGCLTATEINEALLTCIKMCQIESFPEEIASLKGSGTLNKKSKLHSLHPFLDGNEVLRVGGRLNNASIGEDMKHPIVIPHQSTFTTLLVREAHVKTLHGGPQLMLNYLRTKYWVIGAKNLVKQVVRKCVICIRHSAQTNQQMMGQLPTSRVTAHRPFHKCGVDYAGPISIRPTKGRGYHSTKGYICLFICMSTRAIHLEAVSDMTSQGFLAAFKRFVARRGHVADMWSDNGTTFVGSARELKELFDAERSSVVTEIADWLASNGTNWHFIPPHSPNFGGLWEAGVKSAKHHLKRVIGTSTLTFEEMTTTLSQIEACLNSRPISQLSSNPDDPCPLTPGHFLVGEPLVLAPDHNYENSTLSSLKRWHLTQRMVQDFWRRWSHEYLTQLQHRYKWVDQTSEPAVGDVVLVKEDDIPPARWLYGRITAKHPGADKLTRVVSLNYKGHTIKRPVCKLIILPKTD